MGKYFNKEAERDVAKRHATERAGHLRKAGVKPSETKATLGQLRGNTQRINRMDARRARLNKADAMRGKANKAKPNLKIRGRKDSTPKRINPNPKMK